MTTPIAVADSSPQTAAYPPGWLHVMVNRIDRRPGTAWIYYSVIFVVATLAMHGATWSTGSVSVGTFDALNTYWGFLTAAVVWVAVYLERLAASTFDAFQPALTTSAAESARLRYALIVVPAAPALALTVVGALMTALQFAVDPGSQRVAGFSEPATTLVFVIQVFNTAILFQVLYRLIRQMRLVGTILETSVVVDVFRPAPLNAFALLTSRPGAVLTLLVASSVLIAPIPTELGAFLLGWAPYLVVPPVIAVVAFLVPLTGVHAQLVEQKARLQDGAQARLRGILADMDRDIETRDMAGADAYNKTLANLLIERDVLAKLPTWPWSIGTLRSFISAILLPMALFLTQQGLSRLF